MADRFVLKYEWNAADWSSGNANWKDRKSGYNMAKSGTPVKGLDNGEYYLELNMSNYFTIAANSSLPFPIHYMIELDFMRVVNAGKTTFPIDWGSLTTANSGGFGVSLASNGNIADNFKIKSNKTGYGVVAVSGCADNVRHLWRYGCRAADADGNDIQWGELDGKYSTVATKTHTALDFSKSGARYIGRGVGGASYNDGTVRIYSLKIYEDTWRYNDFIKPKFLGFSGLTYLWSKIKSIFATNADMENVSGKYYLK